MTSRVYSGPPGTETVPPMVHEAGNLCRASASSRNRPSAKGTSKGSIEKKSGSLRKLCLAYLPVVTLTTSRAPGHNVFAPDAEERFKHAIDPDIDILPSVGANKVQPFHMRPP